MPVHAAATAIAIVVVHGLFGHTLAGLAREPTADSRRDVALLRPALEQRCV